MAGGGGSRGEEEEDKFTQLYKEQELKAARRERITQKLKDKKQRQEKVKERRKEFKNRLEPVPTCVYQVNVEGLVRTQDHILTGPIKSLFAANNYGEVIEGIKRVHKELKACGCFQTINIYIDANEENEKLLDVTIEVLEAKTLSWVVEPRTTDLGDGKIRGGVFLPNVFGTGEKLEAAASASWSKDTEQTLTFYKPNLTSAFLGPRTILARLGSRSTRIPWSGLRARDHYASLIVFHDPLPWLQWKTKLRLSFRHLYSHSPPSTSTGSGLLFHEREECGHSMETSFTHTLTVDTRDDRVLPRQGFLARARQSVSGYLGDVHALKHRFRTSVYLPLAQNLTLALGADLGFVTPLSHAGVVVKNRLNCYDALCFTGPLQCRGWSNEKLKSSRIASPSETQIVFAASVKLVTNIPLLRGSKSWLLNNTQAHAFCDFGSVGHIPRMTPSKVASLDWMNWESLSAGVGIVLRLGKYGRAELNYVVPVNSFSNCVAKPGLQLGIGVDIL